MNERKFKIYIADFETLTGDVDKTWVWGGTIVLIHDKDYTEDDVRYFHSIEEFFGLCETYASDSHIKVYFHNLKFDGGFILDYLFKHWNHANVNDKFIPDEYMRIHDFKYLISRLGQWYTITCISESGHKIIFCDSLKLLPLSVKSIGDGFKTRHRKTTMEYNGYREPGYSPTIDEVTYMKNDVLVVAEAMTEMIKEGHVKSTIGSCCLNEFKKILRIEQGKNFYKTMFPDLTGVAIDQNIYGSATAEEYIRRSYRGGWCYLKSGCEDKIYHDGCTFDVNSLYPSMMHGDSGNYYPVGEPVFFRGAIPDEIKDNPLKYYFVRIRTRFNIRNGYLPFIQIKNSLFYRCNEMLTTSDIKYQGKTHRYYERDGQIEEQRVILTLTKTDYILFREHYDADIEILDGCYFDAIIGLFDFYIDKYKRIKQSSTGAKRQIAKLFLNSLYGQMAKSPDSSYKVAREVDGVIKFRDVIESNKKVVYVPIGAAITSFARNFTIRAAQSNYDSFIYADTDSIHCRCLPDDIKGIDIDDSAFQKWSLEMEWKTAIFHRQKTYIEINDSDFITKAAGMPEASKRYFMDGLKTGKYKLTDFKCGLELPGKLLPKRIPGGIVLQESTYIIRD